MASFWDTIKSFFRSNANAPLGMSPKELEREVRAALRFKVAKGRAFTAYELAQEIAGAAPDAQAVSAVAASVEWVYEQKEFGDGGAYSRTFRPAPIDGWVYHPLTASAHDYVLPLAPIVPSAPRASAPASQPGAQTAGAKGASAVVVPARGGASNLIVSPASGAIVTPTSAPLVGAGGPYRTAQNPYVPPNGVLGLSPDELRRRALKINPYSTAWIGRVDTIPPQSDERTALIDRGLVLRGLLTEAQIAEIHRVGDLWISYGMHEYRPSWNNEWKKIAQATRTADEAVAELRRQKAAAKAEKKRLAVEREAQRRADVARRKAEDIVFLGRGVSRGLADRRADVAELTRRGLPVLATPADVARALGLSVPRLRWLCFHSDATPRTHYVYFEVPKRSGGTRRLAAPHRDLAAAQQWVLTHVLAALPTEPQAHGFITGRSTVSNAAPHVGKHHVVNLDLSDFFPTISFARVRGVFTRLGYSPAVATVFALLCTEAPRARVEYDGAPYWVAVGARALPQGACTSPALSNQVARKLDRRLAGMCAKHGWTYTRYADDLTFSRARLPDTAGEESGRGAVAPPPGDAGVAMLLARVRHIVQEEGFALNPKKGRIQRAARRQLVTGVVVNDRPGLPREEVRRLRAILHGARATGLAAQNREGRPHFEAWVRGKLAYLAMIDRAKGTAMLRELDALEGRAASTA